MKPVYLILFFSFCTIKTNAQWTEFCSGATNGFVVDFASYNDSLFSTGFFTTVCGESADHIAKWDGSNWIPTTNSFSQNGHAIDSLNGKLYASLYQFTTDSNYVYAYDGAGWQQVGDGVYQNNPGVGFSKNATIYDMISYNDRIIACGDFDTYKDIAVNGIMQWDGTEWSPLGSGLTEFIPGAPQILYPHNMTVFEGKLIVVGNFYKAGGNIVNGIAAWNGTSWEAMGEGFNNSAYAVGVYDGSLYAGGEFTMSGTTSLGRLAKWDGDSWENPGFEIAYSIEPLHEFVHTLKVINGKLYITGGFDQVIIDGITSDAGSILAYDGTTISMLEGGVEGEIEGIIEYNNGFLVAGGFTGAGGFDYENFAAYLPVVGIENEVLSGVEIYPNPASDMLVIRLIENKRCDVQVTDMSGKSVFSDTFSGKTIIPVANWAAGAYFISVKSAESVHSELIFIE